MQKIRGSVKWFKSKIGYGFIVGEDGVEYFVHYSKILGNGFKELHEAQPVTFTPLKGFKGWTAIDVEMIDA